MDNFEILSEEVELLQEDVKKYMKGLIPYSDINDRLTNIGILVDYMIDDTNNRG